MVVNGKRIQRNPMTKTEVSAILRDACERMGCPDLFSKITWKFSMRLTRSLGRASYQTYEIQLSSKLFSLATPAQREDTIRHEAAHLAVGFLYRDRVRQIKPHGREWKQLARMAGAVPKACHKRIEGSEHIRGSRYCHTGYCMCGKVPLTKTIYNRLANGFSSYGCRKCGSSIMLEPRAVWRSLGTFPAPQQPQPAADAEIQAEIARLKAENARLRAKIAA